MIARFRIDAGEQGTLTLKVDSDQERGGHWWEVRIATREVDHGSASTLADAIGAATATAIEFVAGRTHGKKSQALAELYEIQDAIDE